MELGHRKARLRGETSELDGEEARMCHGCAPGVASAQGPNSWTGSGFLF